MAWRADPPRATTPPAPAYSRTNDRFRSPTALTHHPTDTAAPQPPDCTLSQLSSRQSSCGFDSDEYEPRYRFRWDTCLSFFSYITSPFRLSATPTIPFVPGFNRYPDLSFLLPLSLFSDEFARLTGCELVVKKRASEYTRRERPPRRIN